jgi:hypothetical protein
MAHGVEVIALFGLVHGRLDDVPDIAVGQGQDQLHQAVELRLADRDFLHPLAVALGRGLEGFQMAGHLGGGILKLFLALDEFAPVGQGLATSS